MTIVYSFNDGYAMQGGVSLLSLLSNNRDVETINIIIIEDNVSKLNKKNIEHVASSFNRKVTFIALDEITKKLDIETSFSRSAYARLFLASNFTDDKILYFDSDTLIVGSLVDLINLDIDNFFVAGVQDTVNQAYLAGIGLTKEYSYINDGGVIALNLKKWRYHNIESLCVDFIKKHKGSPPHNDQGTINFVCKDAKMILPPQYNLMNPMFMFNVKQLNRLFKMNKYYSQQAVDNAKNNPVVIHYTEELYNRPWFSNCTHPLRKLYLQYHNQSPWANVTFVQKKMSKNAIIQKFVYRFAPFYVYQLMIRFIELRHRYAKRIM